MEIEERAVEEKKRSCEERQRQKRLHKRQSAMLSQTERILPTLPLSLLLQSKRE